jgi:hypothetical protein
MWAASPAAGWPGGSANGYWMFLVTPVLDATGWTGGVIEYAAYFTTPDNTGKYAGTAVRRHDASAGWSPWSTFYPMIWDLGGVWAMNDTEQLSPFLGPSVDSLQFGWSLHDASRPGEFAWGAHSGVQYLVDNVSIGRFDPGSTVFTARTIDVFSDTFSRVDPAHTAFLSNAEEGQWAGNGGARAFAEPDSLSVEVDDVDGLTAGNVDVFWRVGAGTPPVFGAWATKDMVYSDPSPTSPTDEGTYRMQIGDTANEDYSADEAGSLPGDPAADPIWNDGQTVEYYVKGTDNLGNTAVWPGTADEAPTPVYFRFQVLPSGRESTPGVRVLLVDDVDRPALDFENSRGFDPDGGAGSGGFSDPAQRGLRATVVRVAPVGHLQRPGRGLLDPAGTPGTRGGKPRPRRLGGLRRSAEL